MAVAEDFGDGMDQAHIIIVNTPHAILGVAGSLQGVRVLAVADITIECGFPMNVSPIRRPS